MASEKTTDRHQDPARHRKAWFFRGFRDRYAVGYVRKHFHAVRVATASAPIPITTEPVIVVVNHPSWWDPMICTVLSREFSAHYEHFAAIDAEMLKKYGFFKWLGFLGVDTQSLRGAADFLRDSTTLLSQPNRTMWITAQGRFSDVRTRPLQLRSGTGHLAARLDRGLILPIALEYSFWTESKPEALVRIGEPLVIQKTAELSAKIWSERIEAALTQTLDLLNADVMSRDPERFKSILGGSSGVGGMYDMWRRMKMWARGRRFDPSHGNAP